MNNFFLSEKISHLSPIYWTWTSPQNGYLKLIVQPNYEIWQERLHPKDNQPSLQYLGKTSKKEWCYFLDRLQASVYKIGSSSNLNNSEGYILAYDLERGEPKHFELPSSVVKKNPELIYIRKLFLKLPKQIRGGFFNLFKSTGGRLFLVMLAIIIFFSYLLTKDWRSVNYLEKEAQRLEGEVISREGISNGNHSLIIQFKQNEGNKKTIKISEYLSIENWNSSPPGTRVRLWFDQKSEKAWLESDLLRWQHDKKWLPLFPVFFFGLGILALIRLGRYRIGRYSNGQEYIILQDRVIGDDKDMKISRTTLNILRLTWMLLK